MVFSTLGPINLSSPACIIVHYAFKPILHLNFFFFAPQMKPMLTTIGTLDPPLGNARLQASKLIAAILATNSDTINAELANLGTLQVLWVCS